MALGSGRGGRSGNRKSGGQGSVVIKENQSSSSGGGDVKNISGGGNSFSPQQQTQIDQLIAHFKNVPAAEQSRQIATATERYERDIKNSKSLIQTAQDDIKMGDRLLKPLGTSVSRERADLARFKQDLDKATQNLAIVKEVQKRLGR